VKPTTCLPVEAILFGIAYPLKKNWLKQCADVVLSKHQIGVLRKALTEICEEDSRRGYFASKGLKVLERGHVVEMSLHVHRDQFPFQTEEWTYAVRAKINMANSRCQGCGVVSSQLTVKQIKAVPALFLDFDNLLVLCTGCEKDGQYAR